MYGTIDEAQEALRTAELDCAADFGEEGVDAAWADLVRAIAADSTPEVGAELLRRNGLGGGGSDAA